MFCCVKLSVQVCYTLTIQAVKVINDNPYGIGTAIFTTSGATYTATAYQDKVDVGHVR